MQHSTVRFNSNILLGNLGESLRSGDEDHERDSSIEVNVGDEETNFAVEEDTSTNDSARGSFSNATNEVAEVSARQTLYAVKHASHVLAVVIVFIRFLCRSQTDIPSWNYPSCTIVRSTYT